jgi:hypothetical protein
MKGTKKFFTLLIFLLFPIAVTFTSGCSAPIGGLLDGDTAQAVDYIRAAPRRVLYDQRHWFKPADPVEGVLVYGVFGGLEDPNPVDIEKLQFKIIDDPGLTTEVEIIVTDNQEGYPLLNKGVKTIVVSYLGMETRYPIVVGDPGSSGFVNQDGSGTGIEFIWE